MRLFLVRHGQTNHNADGLAQGWTDIDLDRIGELQAEKIANELGSIPFDRIFSSDLVRARRTAEPLAQKLGIKIETSELLRERWLGELENAPLVDLRAAFESEIESTGESRYRCRPKGVESAYEVMDRIHAFAKLLPTEFENIAVFTHGMTEETLLCYLIGAPVESSRSFSFSNASITVLSWDHDAWQLERYNDTSHL